LPFGHMYFPYQATLDIRETAHGQDDARNHKKGKSLYILEKSQVYPLRGAREKRELLATERS